MAATALVMTAAAQPTVALAVPAVAAGKPPASSSSVPKPTAQTTIPAPIAHPGGTAHNGCGQPASSYAWIRTSLGMALSAHLTAGSSGQRVRAAYAVKDDTTGTSIANPAGSNSAYTGPGRFSTWVTAPGVTDTPLNFKPVNGHTYSWKSQTEDMTGQYSPPAATCGFRADLTPPAGPVTSSSAFPPQGTQPAPVTGTFTFTSSDPAPSCAGCQASGVYDFEYSLNQPLPVNYLTPGCGNGSQSAGQAVLATTSRGTATATSCPVTAQWGTNTLYVEAIDHAGNVTQQSTYTFFVPSA